MKNSMRKSRVSYRQVEKILVGAKFHPSDPQFKIIGDADFKYLVRRAMEILDSLGRDLVAVPRRPEDIRMAIRLLALAGVKMGE